VGWWKRQRSAAIRIGSSLLALSGNQRRLGAGQLVDCWRTARNMCVLEKSVFPHGGVLVQPVGPATQIDWPGKRDTYSNRSGFSRPLVGDSVKVEVR